MDAVIRQPGGRATQEQLPTDDLKELQGRSVLKAKYVLRTRNASKKLLAGSACGYSCVFELSISIHDIKNELNIQKQILKPPCG